MKHDLLNLRVSYLFLVTWFNSGLLRKTLAPVYTSAIRSNSGKDREKERRAFST